ncbi:thioesterase family protein [Paralimibaculum aggregatum]|uniref:Thioesterase family protein n=1 Tax=Paralimibaculum aggregatum TaxID=3036245 RepID=A0ABQ6LPL5_9RHOB|nr:thioesterase family protein [Limibaculum sp. NKW23]GMG83278.1 thioesterase family protein [Limibaculum sp. NKW23]
MAEDGFDGKPLRSAAAYVQADWIDYNGHMNVAYYTLAFDRALDEIYERIGIGPGLVESHNMGPMALQTHIHYVGELREGERFACDFRLVDADAKRVHVYVEMLALDRAEALAATYESLTLNVDLGARRSAPFPAAAAARVQALLAAQAGLPKPDRLGAPLGIRRG